MTICVIISQFVKTHLSKKILDSRNSGHADTETYEDSPEEIKQRSAKETEILTGNLGDAIIPAHEILADPAQLRILALLHESMVSFFFCFFSFFNS